MDLVGNCQHRLWPSVEFLPLARVSCVLYMYVVFGVGTKDYILYLLWFVFTQSRFTCSKSTVGTRK